MKKQENKFKDYIADFFNKVAGVYDEIEPRFFDYFGKKLGENIDIQENSRVLDIACGRGAVGLNLLNRYPHLHVTGIDLCPGMVKQLNNELKISDTTNMKILEMDAEELDFKENSFDHVFCGFGVFFFPDYNKTFQEVRRVLKNKGIFAFSSFRGFQEHMLLQDLFDRYIFHHPDEVVTASKQVFNNLSSIEDILAYSGFEKIKIINEKKYFNYQTKEQWWQKQMTHGMRRKIDEIADKDLGSFKQQVFDRLDTVKTKAGYNLFIDVLYTYAVKK